MPAQRMEAPITVGEAVLAIQKRDYLLPAIQREFVWNAVKTESLFDSLMRGYPVGSFLFWKVLPENSQKYKFYEFMQSFDAFDNKRLKPFDVAQDKQLTVVLDGQQRLTSFAIGLLGYRAEKTKGKWTSNPGAYPKKRLHLNLTSKYQGQDELDREYDFRFLTDEELKELSQSGVWFPVRKVLEFREGADVNTEKLMRYSANNNLSGWGAGALAKLCNAILKNNVIYYFQEDEQSLSRVLNIFVRLNSGGVPLSYSDLLLSIASAQWKTDARDAIYGLLDDLNGIGDGFEFDKDFVLKSALVLTDLPDVGFSVENFDKKNTEAIEAGWDTNVRKPLMIATELAAALGYYGKTLTSANVLIPVAYYLRKIQAGPGICVHPKYVKVRGLIRTWLINSLLKSVFSAKTDTLITAVRNAIKTSKSTGFPIADIEKSLLEHGVSLRYSDEELDSLLSSEYGRRDTFSVLAALYPSLNTQFKFHIDHIFPKSGFHKTALRKASFSEEQIERYQERMNQVPNLQLLEGVVNQAKLDTPFDKWIAPLQKKKSEWGRYCEQHAIPPLDNYTLMQFDKFFENRRALLKKKLRETL